MANSKAVSDRRDQLPAGVFKRCRFCGTEWHDSEEFLNDPCVLIAGSPAASMRPFIASATQGLLVFVHQQPACGSTLLVAPDLLRAGAGRDPFTSLGHSEAAA